MFLREGFKDSKHLMTECKENVIQNELHSAWKSKQDTVNMMHLASWLGSFPDAEVADEPGQSQTHGQLPAHSPHVLDTIWYLQHSASEKQTHHGKTVIYQAEISLYSLF